MFDILGFLQVILGVLGLLTDDKSNVITPSNETIVIHKNYFSTNEVICGNCHRVNRDPDEYCEYCGAALYEICPYCNKKKPVIKLRCTHCGHDTKELHFFDESFKKLWRKAIILTVIGLVQLLIVFITHSSIYWINTALLFTLAFSGICLFIDSCIDFFWIYKSEFHNGKKDKWSRSSIIILDRTTAFYFFNSLLFLCVTYLSIRGIGR